ncbi:unnamed protein product [Prunus armeniaca]|uniref:Uncharacterized protein n=1 Tax=Prunus armeniaca TaxID=36596 RepID=A0A6J5TNN5_PRUAR|nr:unnamed protein product [Prunus armeniaca]
MKADLGAEANLGAPGMRYVVKMREDVGERERERERGRQAEKERVGQFFSGLGLGSNWQQRDIRSKARDVYELSHNDNMARKIAALNKKMDPMMSKNVTPKPVENNKLQDAF